MQKIQEVLERDGQQTCKTHNMSGDFCIVFVCIVIQY